MDIYHIWCDLKLAVSDMEFSDNVGTYLGDLRQSDHIADFRITQRKLGLGLETLGEFHIMIEARDLAQFDQAFQRVAAHTGKIKGLHYAVNSLVDNAKFALYRGFPDPVRQQGAEKF
ncbi:MAG: hypothetical protein QF450_06340 [Rhodospirillales bacterium]|jgi:hypothetical protein|nr:hypothetical protein [Rhodospirillales bacterium]